ncbi:MAG: hypothetical protein COV44_00210 [Deltaproteobacteria bacterium CG11_big_fil_rev_8_21_14_0_20_45_16]|nr:MAG: hypothetical protein COV44_00210 [Deltaproteobacteria bacterium CG11_big_fil_rev_8_21_14_0_20_45_16]
MARPARKFEPEFKMKVILSILRGEASQEAIARQHSLAPTLVSKWKEKFLSGGLEKLKVDSRRSSQSVSELHQLQTEIEKRDQVIGELTLANRLLKKDLRMI